MNILLFAAGAYFAFFVIVFWFLFRDNACFLCGGGPRECKCPPHNIDRA